MHPETQFAFVAAFAGFLLKTSFGFCICWAMARAAVRPHSRFLIWFTYLVAAASYWLWSLASLAQHIPAVESAAGSAALPVRPPFGTVHVVTFWVAPLSFLPPLLGAFYILALLYLFFSHVKKRLHLRWILRFTFEPPPEVETLFRPIARDLGVPKVRLLMLSGIYSPATFGWIKPTILVPPLCLEQDQAELMDILRHELQHIRRRDSVFNSLASLCRSVLFFHPAAWYAMRSLSLQSELACDLAVVGNSPERRATYAECLVRFARQRVAGEPVPWNLDFAGASSQLKVRIRSMLTGDRTVSPWRRVLRAASGTLLLVAFSAVAPSLFIVLSYQQPTIAPSLVAPVSESISPHRSLKRGFTGRSFGPRRARFSPEGSGPEHSMRTAAKLSPAAGEEAIAGASSNGPRRLPSLLSSSSNPVLKLRGSAIAKTTQPAPTGTILLSTPAESGSESLTRGVSAASVLAAGAGEAARVASHGREKN